ncbi:MAG: TlpA disulfide reductase family protein [Gammaproteobacteria bacterium]|nr:TlpA disulfide reductase family protein [Gammaproteobacteria bacterium]
MKACLGLVMSVWLTLMLAATETETPGSQEFSITGEFSAESELKADATVLVSQEDLTDTGVIEAVELVSGKFSDGEVLLSGMVDNPTLVTITVSFADYDAISTSAVVAPDDDLVFRVLQAADGTPNRVMFVGNVRLHQNESKKFTVKGDLSALEEIVPGTTVNVTGFDSEGSKNYGSILVADNGTFKVENEVDEPRVVRIRVQNTQGFFYGSQTILEPQVSISLVPDSKGSSLITHSDSHYHATLIESWAKSKEYLALEDAHQIASEKYEVEMAASSETTDQWKQEGGNESETNEDTSTDNDELDNAQEFLGDKTKETIPILALSLSIPPAKECEHVDLTQVKAGQEDLFEWTLPEHIKIQKEMARFRYSALEEIAQHSKDPIESLLALELGAFAYFSDDFYRVLDVIAELAARLDDDLSERRLLPMKSGLAPIVQDELINRNLVPGQKAPTFTLSDLEGVDHSLQQTLETNDVVLVEWWASWCGPCIEKFPKLKKLHASYDQAGFQVITINVDDSFDDWKQESEKHQLPWLDLGEGGESGPVTKSYGILRYPMGYVIDKKGCVVQKDLGIDMLNEFLVKKYD